MGGRVRGGVGLGGQGGCERRIEFFWEKFRRGGGVGGWGSRRVGGGVCWGGGGSGWM